MSLRDMKSVFLPDGFEESFVKSTIVELLYALDFLHTHGEVVHTGITTFIYISFYNLSTTFADVLLQMYTRATCCWESMTTTLCKDLKRMNSHLQYLVNQYRLQGQYISHA